MSRGNVMFCQLFLCKFLKFFIVSFSLFKCNYCWMIEKKQNKNKTAKFNWRTCQLKIISNTFSEGQMYFDCTEINFVAKTCCTSYLHPPHFVSLYFLVLCNKCSKSIEAVSRRCSVNKVLLKISQNSQENTYRARVFFK